MSIVEPTDLGEHEEQVQERESAATEASNEDRRTKEGLNLAEELEQSASDKLNELSECNSCESSSACTVLPNAVHRGEELSCCSDEEEIGALSGDQILSIRRLQFASEARPRISSNEHQVVGAFDTFGEEALEEVNLNGDNLSISRENIDINIHTNNISNDANSINNNLPNGDTMFSSSPSAYLHTVPQQNRTAIAPNNGRQFRGFGEAQPRLCFASQRVKEYFESFKSHSGETANLYQFFKSTRTELVACLIFAIVTSQALIVCRTHLEEAGALSSSASVLMNKKGELQERGASELYTLQVPKSNQASVHLVSGLLTAFTVATLTQIFGHISGCHLIPSISLALYVKGHISRARLASYLVAQSAGSLLGVSLLSLLTTSQMSLEEYRELLLSRGNLRFAQLSGQWPPGQPLAERRRRRREVGRGDDMEDINLNDIQGSETILLSIAEQQQQQQQQQRRHRDGRIPEQRTIITNVSTYQVSREPKEFAPSNSAPSDPMAPASDRQQRRQTATGKLASPSSSPTDEPRAPGEPRVENITQLQPATSFTQERRADGTANDKSRGGVSQEDHSGSETLASASSLPKSNDVGKILALNAQDNNQTAGPPNIRLRRKKTRNRRQQQQQQPSNETNTIHPTGSLPNSSSSLDPKHYINMLKFTLPDSIMSSESIRQCIDRQQIDEVTGKRLEEQGTASLAARSFVNCLSLSNSSQMFVFQFIATLLIVLTYLVNVEPRRVDLGFKSLSIGLSYFVASLLTVHSGGYFGSPSQLIFITWLSPSSEWQSEWIIYLITPFIGGVFGAMSHEYIDYSSAPNRNKQLHLRRSFYSLDNLQGSQMKSEIAVEISALSADSRRLDRRRVNSSSSIDSNGASSSVLTLAGPDEPGMQQQPPQLNSAVIENRGTSRKLSSYARQVRMEQRAARQVGANGVGYQAKELGERHRSCQRLDFNSNFLISSSPSSAPANGHTMNVANGFM